MDLALRSLLLGGVMLTVLLVTAHNLIPPIRSQADQGSMAPKTREIDSSVRAGDERDQRDRVIDTTGRADN